MRHLIMPLLAAGALLVSTGASYADLGDQLFKLLSDNGPAHDQFGISVAISGTPGEEIAIVGAIFDEDSGDHSGSAFLFDTTTGQQLLKLLPDDGGEGDEFGFRVAISGTTAIVAARSDDDSGSAYLFDTITGVQIAKLLPKDGAGYDQFGTSVAISGEIAVVGAVDDGENGNGSGSAYLFDTIIGRQVAELLPDDGAALDQFGFSVAISGTTAIIGAWADDDNGNASGSVYLFDISDPQNPVQIFKLLPSDGAAGDRFGISVAISGATAIVGAERDDDNGLDSGSAYLFDTVTGKQIAKLLADDGAQFDWFGGSVAISTATAIVGAFQDDDYGAASGSAYVFETATGRQIAKLVPNDGAQFDAFGYSVAISCTIAIVGSPLDDDNGGNSGAAYLFDAAAPGKCPWDVNGDGVVNHHDILEVVHNMGPCVDPDNCPWDVNGDGIVNGRDVAAVATHFGRCP